MTREEAIEVIKAYRDNLTDSASNQLDGDIEAFDIVIKALEQEPCEDAISRQAVIDITWEEPSYTDALNVLTEVRDKVKALPTVNPQEPKTGHWIEQIDYEENCRTLICSNCDRPALHDEDSIWKHKFCPHCGAKMIEPQETETWNGIHAQLTAPKGTFERIFNDADDDNDI